MNSKEIYKNIINSNYISLTDQDAYGCLNLITKLYPIYENPLKTEDDIFLCLAAQNYLNAYVKVDKDKAIKVFKQFYSEHPEIEKYIYERYQLYPNMQNKKPYTKCENKQDIYRCFKKTVKILMHYVKENFKDSKIVLSPQRESGMDLAMVELYGVQFSFHRVNFYPEDGEFNDMKRDSSTWVKWNGVRLQPLAKATLNLAKQLDNVSTNNLNLINANIEENVNIA